MLLVPFTAVGERPEKTKDVPSAYGMKPHRTIRTFPVAARLSKIAHLHFMPATAASCSLYPTRRCVSGLVSGSRKQQVRDTKNVCDHNGTDREFQ